MLWCAVYLIHHVLSHQKSLNQAALSAPRETFFFSIFSSSKEQSFITLSLLISHKTIGGSLWLSRAHIQLLVDDSQDCASPWGALSSPPLSYCTPHALSRCLSSSLHSFSLPCALSNLLYSSFQPPTLSLCPRSTCQLFFPSDAPLSRLPPSSSPPSHIFSLTSLLFSFPSSRRDYSPGSESLKR